MSPLPRARSAVAGVLMAVSVIPVAWARMDYPLDEQPMYGGGDLKDGQAAQNEKILVECKKMAGKKTDSASVSGACASLGFKAFHDGNFRRAMLFFNNAWVLQPDNGGAYHGFALVLTERDENDVEAEKMFQKAMSLPHSTPGVYMDYARFLILYERYDDAIPVLEAGMAKAERSKADFQFGLVTAYEQLHEYPKACDLARQIVGDLKDAKREAVQEFIGGEHCRAS